MPDINKHIDFDRTPGENPFIAPDHYFEQLGPRIFNKIRDLDKDNEKQPSKPVLSIFKNQLALAASLIGLAFISYLSVRFILSREAIHKDVFQYSEIMESGMDDFDEGMLLEVFMDSDPEYISSDNDLYQEEIITYLVDEDIDLVLISEEL